MNLLASADFCRFSAVVLLMPINCSIRVLPLASSWVIIGAKSFKATFFMCCLTVASLGYSIFFSKYTFLKIVSCIVILAGILSIKSSPLILFSLILLIIPKSEDPPCSSIKAFRTLVQCASISACSSSILLSISSKELLSI